MRRRGGRHFSVGISEAKSSLSELVELDQPTILLRRGRPVGAILSISELNEYETLRAAFADPEVLRSLVDPDPATRHLPLSELGTEADLRAAIAERGSAKRKPSTGARSAAAPGADGDSRSRTSRRR